MTVCRIDRWLSFSRLLALGVLALTGASSAAESAPFSSRIGAEETAQTAMAERPSDDDARAPAPDFSQAPAPEGADKAASDAQTLAPQSAPVALTPPPAFQPVDLGEPVKTVPLGAIDPDSLGLVDQAHGGLGSNMWDGTPRSLIDKLLPALHLPTSSAALNDLARRLLTSVAAAPIGPAGEQNLTTLRIDRLLALGDAKDAWAMAQMARPGRVDALTLRSLTENAFLQLDPAQVCAKVPDMIASHPETDPNAVAWQQLLILCKIKAGDKAAAQLAVDVLHEQKVADDPFLAVVEKNTLGGSKNLPKRLSASDPLMMAALLQTGLPLPGALFAEAQLSYAPALLAARATDEKPRLALAEKAASMGIIDRTLLARVYADQSFTADQLADPLASKDQGARLHALIYQALQAGIDPARRAALLTRLAQTPGEVPLTGTLAGLWAAEVTPLAFAPELASFAPWAARLLVAAGQIDAARVWLDKAGGAPVKDWPLFALADLVPDTAFAGQMQAWLTDFMGAGSVKDKRERAEAVLALLSAAGYAVSEDAVLRVIDAGLLSETGPAPAPILYARLREAGERGRVGETVLLSLLMAEHDPGKAKSLFVTIDSVRALRQAGLVAEARRRAREVVLTLLDAGD